MIPTCVKDMKKTKIIAKNFVYHVIHFLLDYHNYLLILQG